jgi:RNA polymerase sigma-70 factor (ECF subfamily)
MNGGDTRGGGAFLPTRWSLVARAADGREPEAAGALESLCSAYWYPLYAFLRRHGRSPQDAEDLVQGFFAEAIEKGRLARADPARGRFRTFLLASLRHHASNEAERGRASKRGGGRRLTSLDAVDAERRYALEPSTHETPERLFERQWAREVLARALRRASERARSGPPERAERFEALLPLFWDDGPPQREVAERLGIGETAVKVALHRLRAQVREDLRAEVLETLADPGDLEDEMRRLAAALRPSGRPSG